MSSVRGVLRTALHTLEAGVPSGAVTVINNENLVNVKMRAGTTEKETAVPASVNYRLSDGSHRIMTSFDVVKLQNPQKVVLIKNLDGRGRVNYVHLI